MSDNDSNINVEEIMSQIRAEIKASGADQTPLSFADQNAVATGDRLDEAVKYISYNYEIQPYEVYTGNPVKVFIKKAIRKTVSYFILPIVAQQNRLNADFQVVSEAVKDQRDRIASMEKTLEELNARLDKLSGDNK